MKSLLILLLLLGTTCLTAQTRRIAHRSHSGTDGSLVLSSDGNFGLGPANYYFVEPDTVHAVDTAQTATVPAPATKPATPATVPSTTVPSVPPVPAAPPALQKEPEQPQNVPPGSDAAIPSGRLQGAVESGTERSAAIAVADGGTLSSSRGEQNRHRSQGRLLLLAFGLALPVAGMVLYGVRRKGRSEHPTA